MRCRILILVLVLAGCSTQKKPYKPVRQKATPEQARQLRQVHDLWKAEDPKFPAARDQILEDPVTAAWWSRTLIGYAVGSHKQYMAQQRDLLGAVKVKEPLGYKKALAELRIADGVAVPVVVAELLRHHDIKNRALGVQILIYMGPGIVPDLQPYLAHQDKRVQRQVLQVLGGLASDARAQQLLIANIRNPEWSIRAQALESLALAGDAHLPLLHQAALHDPDPFVRRRVVAALAQFKDRQTATVVVAYYQEVLRQGDRQGIRAAQRTLQAMSGIRGGHTESFWQRWLEGLPAKPAKPAKPARPAKAEPRKRGGEGR
jgi:hypothetical protein